MARYWVKTPLWLKKLFPKNVVWDIPAQDEPAVYLTFDDGPHPKATPFIIDQLARHKATATFFCIGKNVLLYPEVYRALLGKGHRVGNHTHNHVNGWKVRNAAYIRNIRMATRYIKSTAFRPPYGKIRLSQTKKINRLYPDWKIYMWDVLSGDFDRDITPQQCLDNVLQHLAPGSIVVFHDSDKAWERMSYALPHVLDYCQKMNWKVRALPTD